MTTIATTYSTQELAHYLGITVKSVHIRAKREGWQALPRAGRGGGKLWVVSSMPAEIRDRLASALLRQPAAITEENTACASIGSNICAPIGTAGNGPALSDRERAIVTARLAFCRELDRIAPLVGKKAAVAHLVTSSRMGELSPVLTEQLAVAFARRRGDSLTTRTLYRWYADYLAGGEAALAPKRTAAKAPAWASEFLFHYQKPQHPTVALAHAELCRAMRQRGELPPSVHACRRLLAKMSQPEREAGRATGNVLLKLRPYQRRDTSELWPTDVYTADGTTFDAEVLHPDHGQPFKPEITAILDVATRRCVGISVALSESALTVLDALRMACCYGGVPALFYSDGGPGYVNRLLLDDRTGMMTRLGITPTNAIPGRPQGKGLMERAVKTLWVRAAQGLESYTGALMDGDAAHRNFKLSRAALKAGKRAVLPSWEEFKRHILARVEEYNTTPHRGLPRYRDAQGRLRHYSPEEYWQTFTARGFTPMRVPQGMEAELFMPGARRVTRNGWLQFYSGRYYAPELAEFHGEAVEVRYDIWDAGRVWCWTLDGRPICEATLEGNSRPYFEQSRVEAAREKRARAQVKRLDAKLQRVAPGATIVLPEIKANGPDTGTTVSCADSTAPALAPAAAVETITASAVATQEATDKDSNLLRGRTAKENAVAIRKPAETGNGYRITDVTPTPEPVPVRPLFACTHERYRWLMHHPDARTDADSAWLRDYRRGEEYADLKDLYAAEGIA